MKEEAAAAQTTAEFLGEVGPWVAGCERGSVFIQSDDFTHDVRLYVNGDFADVQQKLNYAAEIARRLNAWSESNAR